MLTILVAHSYFLSFDRKQQARAKPYPPLATLQTASMLRHAGHRVHVFDAMLSDGLSDYQRLLATTPPQLLLLYEDSFNFLSKMCLQRMRDAACAMIELARRAGARALAVGSDASDEPGPYLRAGADIVLLGEGLDTLQTLVQRLDADPAAPVQALSEGQTGIATVSGSDVKIRRGSQPSGAPPYAPAWDLIDLERYRDVWRRAHGYFSLNLAASRGCSFRCHWCAKPIWGNRYLQRPAHEVAAEMTELKRRFGAEHVWFADDIFGFRVEWVSQFAQALRTFDGAIPFTIQTRADLVSTAMARALKDAGCVEAWIGAESGSQRVLDAMNKGITVEQILSARSRLQSERIRVGLFIQLGYLGEELDDILATRELIERADPDDIGVSVSYPLPGTVFYERVKRQLGAKRHWQESNDLEMMFHGRYCSSFYRTVRDLLHEHVTVHRRPRPDADIEPELHSLRLRWEQLIASEQGYRQTQGRLTETD
jgi:anaerobic magnesium-protoporphyrin IX monomethyl ester cyclase